MDRLIFKLYRNETTVPDLVQQHKAMINKEFFFRLAELANASNGETRER